MLSPIFLYFYNNHEIILSLEQETRGLRSLTQWRTQKNLIILHYIRRLVQCLPDDASNFFMQTLHTLDLLCSRELEKFFYLGIYFCPWSGFFTFKKLLIHISSMLSSFIKVLNETQKCQGAKVRYVYLCSTIELDTYIYHIKRPCIRNSTQ